MSTPSDLSNELLGWFPKLSPLLAPKMVQRAWRDIRKSRQWSFLRSEGGLVVPALVNVGTAAVVQNSATVTLDANATAALVALGLPAVPIAERQFRTSGGSLYNIQNWDGAGILTLNHPYRESSSASTPYQIYKCYFQAPSPDFLRFLSFVDPVAGYRMRRRNLNWTKEMVDRRDPLRGAFDSPVVIAAYRYGTYNYSAGSYNVPVFELWPHPIAAQAYNVAYQREGLDPAPLDPFPALIPDALLLSRAKFYALQWLQLNVKEMEVSPAMLATETALYVDELRMAKRQDDEIYTTSYTENEDDSALSGPIDPNYAQGHDYFYI